VDRAAEWLVAILADPASYSLPAYGSWMTPERAARHFASWEADERGGVTAPALCRRCGTSLRFPERPSSQLHTWCKPPLPPEGS
jgi:hypothetical protein